MLSEIISILLIVIPLAYASVVLGKLVPQTLALRRPLFVARLTALCLTFIDQYIGPIISLCETSTKKINLFPKRHTTSEDRRAVISSK
jgi:putative hemolysin